MVAQNVARARCTSSAGRPRSAATAVASLAPPTKISGAGMAVAISSSG